MKQIAKLTLTSIIIITMSVPGYAATKCETAVIDAGMELKMALNKAIEALPEKAVYDRTRQALIEANEFTMANVSRQLHKIERAIAYAKLNAPADQAKVLDDLQKNLDDLNKADWKLFKENLTVIGALLTTTIGGGIAVLVAIEAIKDTE